MRLTRELVLGACALLAGVAALAGPLNPPTGALAPTYKTLHDVEPRTAVTPVGAGVTISSPGSYYLTDNFVYGGSATGAAITIASNDVTLDLNGFTISSVLGQTGNTASAIRGLPAGPNINIVIKNGGIRGFGGNAVDFPSASTARATDVAVLNCGGMAVRFSGTHCRIDRCSFTGCVGGGVSLGTNAVVKDNNIYSCGDVTMGTGDSVVTQGYSTIEGNNIEYSGARGVSAVFGTVVRNNTLRNTQKSAVYANYDCVVEGNIIVQCNNGNSTTEASIWVDNRSSVRRNTVSISRNAGIYVNSSASILQDNQVLNLSSGSAIFLNVSGCYLFDNKYAGPLSTAAGVTYTNGPGNANF